MSDPVLFHIGLFNAIWDGWLKSLGEKIPELSENFVHVQNKLFALQQMKGVGEPEQYFEQFAGPHLHFIFQRDTDFFDQVYKDTEGECLPRDFVKYYHTLTIEDQQYVWKTLELLLEYAGKINPEFRLLCEDVRQKTTL